MSRLVTPSTGRLTGADAEQVRREHADKIAELQQMPAAGMTIIPNVTLTDGVATPIAHRLGRPVLWSSPSPPRGALTSGSIEEVRDGSYNRKEFVVLKASGWGATITVDLAVL